MTTLEQLYRAQEALRLALSLQKEQSNYGDMYALSSYAVIKHLDDMIVTLKKKLAGKE